jgi:2-polyprenyl-3-methyl-5-hydroxy-6-metoxy-1,4-benzoquinol methylase
MVNKHRREPEEFVKEWYGKNSEVEWRRLRQDPYHQLEHMVTMHFLQKYLPKRGLVLDAGGGPGSYAIELAKAGYNIVLLDLVPEMLELAQRKAKQARVKRNFKGFLQGSIEDLSRFQDATFDAVMCLGGPLNHLLSEKQRENATKELVRVAKRNAPIFVSVISRLGLLRTILTGFPHEMCYAKHHWETGDYIPGEYGQGFTAAHWFLPEELHRLFEKQNVQVLEMAGLEGLSSLHRKETNKLYRDQEKWRMWIEIIMETCTHPSVVGNAEHFLLVAKKKD